MSRVLLIALLVLAPVLNSLSEPSSASEQMPVFHHTFWDNAGFGAVYDIQQDREGYLWLQTGNGIFRFDGARFLSVDEVTGGAVRNASGLDAVLPASSGGIWFMPHNAGLILWKNGQVHKFPDPKCAGRLSEAPDGSLWIAGSSGLFHLKGKCVRPLAVSGALRPRFLPVFW